MSQAQEFFYKLPGTPGGNRPGAHRSRSVGSGMSFASHRKLIDQPDPRRLDLRASLRDVRREWLVKVYRQNSSVTIQAIVDVSASMHFGGERSKLKVVEDFINALGYSAFRHGDAVGLMAFDDEARDDIYMPPRTNRGAGITMVETLAGNTQVASARKGSLRGLSDCASQLGATSALVFLISDFHMPLDSLSAVIREFGGSTIVPIVVWDPSETRPPEKNGWLSVRDAETGRRRQLWLRDSTRKQWLGNVTRRRSELTEAFTDQDIQPFFIEGKFNPEHLTQYFMEMVS